VLLKCKRCQGIYVVLLGLLSVAALLWLFGHSAPSTAMTYASLTQPEPFTSEYYATVNERFGVGFSTGITITVNGTARPVQISDYDIEQLHIGWYADWRTRLEPLLPAGLRYVQIVLVRASLYPTNTLNLTATVAANPGSLWLIGNEPEAKYGQGNRTPGEYVDIYHHLYTLIKSVDPTAWIAIGGVIEPTPLRLQWLDMVLGEYQSRFGEPMPVDVWNIHMQILQEKAGSWGAEIPAGLTATEGQLYDFQDNANPTLFRQLVTDFRQWMKNRGFQSKPLIISEYGVLLPSSYIGDGDADKGDQMVIDFMRETFNFLVDAQDPDLGYPADDNRLVQQWLWYSLNSRPYDPATGQGFNGALFSYQDPTLMTKFGAVFREYMHALLGYPQIMLPAVIRNSSPH